MKNMKKSMLALLLAAGVVGGGIVTSEKFANASAVAGDAKEGKEKTLEGHMEDLNDDMKKIRKTLKKADKNADSLAALERMQLSTVYSKPMTPRMGAKMPAPALKKMTDGYRIMMAEQLILLAQMEIEVLKGNNKKAYDMYKGLTSLKKKGHDAYIEEE